MSKKKKVNKRAKRKSAKPRVDPQKLLLKKINRIKERVPHIEPTGECKDEHTGELLFRYTEAQHVFKVYRAELDEEGLKWRPYADEHIQPTVIAVGNMPCLIGYWCIEDVETGAIQVGWGIGQGRNRDWSGNTAGTRTLKQFLLTTFEATWEDPEDPKMNREQMREEVIRELEADGTLARIEEIRFFAQTVGQRGKKDGNSRRADSQSRKRTSNKKN